MIFNSFAITKTLTKINLIRFNNATKKNMVKTILYDFSENSKISVINVKQYIKTISRWKNENFYLAILETINFIQFKLKVNIEAKNNLL